MNKSNDPTEINQASGAGICVNGMARFQAALARLVERTAKGIDIST